MHSVISFSHIPMIVFKIFSYFSLGSLIKNLRIKKCIFHMCTNQVSVISHLSYWNIQSIFPNSLLEIGRIFILLPQFHKNIELNRCIARARLQNLGRCLCKQRALPLKFHHLHHKPTSASPLFPHMSHKHAQVHTHIVSCVFHSVCVL